ncbi:MAG: hypothetical protein M3357_13175, partial [Actinomycetota bacterium]|nr:hypothetical protein [Actinomycetota bacterium]
MADTLTPGARGAHDRHQDGVGSPDGGPPPHGEVVAAPPGPGSLTPCSPRLVAWAALVVGTAVALILVSPAFGPGPPAGEDVMAHLVRADFGIPELVARGRLDGWFPRFVLGHQEFLFNGPGLVWLMALLRGATLGLLSNTGALKVISIGSYVAVVPAVWFLARGFGLSRRAAGLGAVLATCVSNPFGVGLEGLFDVGLIPHQVGAVLFCLALGACLRLLDDPRVRWRALAASALAGLAVTHLISTLVLAVMLALCLITLAPVGGVPWAGLRRLAGTGLVAAGLAGFWLVPLAVHHDLRGVVTTWGTPPLGERLADIARGEILLPTGVGAVAVVAWVFLLCRRRPPAMVLAVVPLAYLAVAHGSVSWLSGNEVTMQLANRGLGYVGLLGVLGVAAFLAAVTSPLGVAGHLAAVAAVAALALGAAPGRDAPRQLDEPIPPMRAAAAVLSRLVPDGARFATQRDFPLEIGRTGVIHPETWLARVSGRNSLNGFNLESSSTPGAAFAPDRLDESGPRASARRLSRFGVTHVVTTDEALFGELTGSGRFRPVWRERPVAILEVVPEPGQPGPASLLSAPRPLLARLTDARAEHLAVELEAPEPIVATVALAWSPKWHARLDDRPVDLGRTSDGLVTVEIPQGAGRLRLDYRADGWDRLGAAITLLTLLAAA